MTSTETITKAIVAEVADRASKARQRSNISVASLSSLSGISRTSLTRKLKGEVGFTLVETLAVAKILDVDVQDFFVTPAEVGL